MAEQLLPLAEQLLASPITDAMQTPLFVDLGTFQTFFRLTAPVAAAKVRLFSGEASSFCRRSQILAIHPDSYRSVLILLIRSDSTDRQGG